jgi:hypothetical protein
LNNANSANGITLNHAGDGGVGIDVSLSNAGNTNSAIRINTAGTGQAIEIADGGGSVKLSFGTAAAGTFTLPDDVSVYVFTDGVAGNVTMPAHAAGKVLYLKNTDPVDTVTLLLADSGVNFSLVALQGITLISDGATWHIVGNY